MTNRRFNEAEVAAIFERATEAQQVARRQAPPGEGLTLAELQDIGREVGISSDLIVAAAQAIEQGGRPASRTVFGLPLGVERTVELDRRLSDDEWERFVVDLRETFDARGTVKREGSLRQWSNGNLQALLEPTANGQRIRLRTVKGDARAMMVGGLGMFGAAAVGLVAAVLGGAVGDAGMLSAMGFMAIMGATMAGASAVRLPRWAQIRRQQMEELALRIAVVATLPPSDDSRDHE
jgi:hypothetical protein